MKKYHEIAIVKEGTKIVDYIISNTDLDSMHGKVSDWGYVNEEVFKEMVKDSSVQYLELKDNKIVCEYTDEEKEQLRKKAGLAGKKLIKYINDCKNYYFDMDVQFKLEHIEKTELNPCVAACVGEMTSIFGIEMASVVFYCRNYITMKEFLNTVIEKNFGVISYYNRMGAGILVPVSLLLKSSEILGNDIRVLWNTDTTRFLAKNNLGFNIPVIAAKVNSKRMIDVCNILDQQTNSLEY